MEKIDFSNNQAPFIDADNLNLMQNNVENVTQRDITTDGEPVKCGYKIDGKDVYVKRVGCGNLPNATTNKIASGLFSTDIKIVKPLSGEGNASSGYSIPLPYVSTVQTSCIGLTFLNTGEISIATGFDYSAYIGYVDIYFTYNE